MNRGLRAPGRGTRREVVRAHIGSVEGATHVPLVAVAGEQATGSPQEQAQAPIEKRGNQNLVCPGTVEALGDRFRCRSHR